MTRIVKKWWKTFTFWDKFRMSLGAVGIGGEITLYLAESYPKWKVVAALATGLGILISYFFKDEDKNGVVDIFDKK